MIDISVNCENAIARIQKMQATLRHFPDQMGDELFNWEAEDLHRKRPFVSRKGKRAFTFIQQHSIAEMRRAQAASQAARKKHHRGPRHWSTRPILRETMFAKFVIRMQRLLGEKIQW
jgi:hypothetical protein